jgi:hypothetical protein
MNTRKNLRAHPLGYHVAVVDGDKDPGHPALVDLRRYKETRLEHEMPACIFGTHSLFSYGIVYGVYFILYNEDSEIIGWASTAMDETDPIARRIVLLCTNTEGYKGAGTVLMLAILRYARAEGTRSVVLDALYTSVPFYKSLGFKATGDCEDEVCPMQLVLQKGGARGKRRYSRGRILRHSLRRSLCHK